MFYPFPLVVVSHYSHYCSLEGQTLPSNCLLASLSKSAGLKQKPSFSCLGFTEPQTWMSDTFFTLISQFSYLVLCSFPFITVSRNCLLFPHHSTANSLYICLPLGISAVFKPSPRLHWLYQPVLIDTKRTFPKCKQGHVPPHFKS